MSKRTFGLDLSGYTRAGSALAEISRSQGYIATVYRRHPFAVQAAGRDHLIDLVSEQRGALHRLIGYGSVLVDVPIDLQGLPNPTTPKFVWQLTARPIDFAYGALRPFADRLGAPVARFQQIISESAHATIPGSNNILETYPAASLQRAGVPLKKYKEQQISWNGGQWSGGEMLTKIARALQLVAEESVVLSDDDVDAIMCALAGALPRESILCGDALAIDMRARLVEKSRKADKAALDRLNPPMGYQLFKKLPDMCVTVQVRDWPPHQ